MRTRFLLLLACVTALCFSQAMLTNDSIVKMVKAGLSEDIVLSSIHSQPGRYSTGADDLIALKSAGVSDKIIAAMMNGGGAAAPAAAPAPAAAGGPIVAEIGVYYRKNDQWADLNPEVVNFKTGGVLKSIGTAGIVKGDVNGHVEGMKSPNRIASPVDLLVYTPDGVAITEYQLLRLRDCKDCREFRTVTGGVMHVSGGATRDIVPFEAKSAGKRMWRVLLPNLGAGEYGFLPPGAFGSANSASIGKMYTFRLLE